MSLVEKEFWRIPLRGSFKIFRGHLGVHLTSLSSLSLSFLKRRPTLIQPRWDLGSSMCFEALFWL